MMVARRANVILLLCLSLSGCLFDKSHETPPDDSDLTTAYPTPRGETPQPTPSTTTTRPFATTIPATRLVTPTTKAVTQNPTPVAPIKPVAPTVQTTSSSPTPTSPWTGGDRITIVQVQPNGEPQSIPRDQQSDYEIELLRSLRRDEQPSEIYSLQVFYPGNGSAQTIEIRLVGNGAVLHLYEQGVTDRYFERTLGASELAELTGTIRTQKVDTLPSLDFQAWDGIEYCYLHLAPTGGHRLRINNPREEDGIYFELPQLFRKLADPEALKVRYELNHAPPGMEVLYASPENRIYRVWADKEDVRVQVGGYHTSVMQWQSLSNDGKLKRETQAPGETFVDAVGGADASAAAVGLAAYRDDARPWQTRWGDKYIRGGAVSDDNTGTFACQAGAPPEKLFDAVVHYPLVTRDGKWLIGSVDDKLAIYDLTTKKPAPLADATITLKFLPLIETAAGVVLVHHPVTPFGDQGPRAAQFQLLDPSTGQSHEIKGDFTPLLEPSQRPLQPTTQPGIVWAAQPDPASNTTTVYRYDAGAFKFLTFFIVPSLLFKSEQMWLDESNGRIYIVYNGHLLRVPVSGDVYKPWDTWNQVLEPENGKKE